MNPQPRIDHGIVAGAHAAGTDRMTLRIETLAQPPLQLVILLSTAAWFQLGPAPAIERRVGDHLTDQPQSRDENSPIGRTCQVVVPDQRRGERIAAAKPDPPSALGTQQGDSNAEAVLSPPPDQAVSGDRYDA